METISPPNHRLAIFTFIICLVASLLLLGLAGALGTFGLTVLVDEDYESAVRLLALAAGTLFAAFLLAPGAYLSYKRMNGIEQTVQQVKRPWLLWAVPGMGFLWPLSLAAGNWAASNLEWGWSILPIANLLAAGLPIAVLTAFALNHIRVGPPWRAWSIFGLGMTVGPFLLIITEVMLVALVFVLFLLYVGVTPGMPAAIQQFAEQVQSAPDEEHLLRLVTPIWTSPLTLLITLLVLAIGMPIVEELLKPIGVWLFADHISSPGEGFALGILSGAGYALFETLELSTQVGLNWAGLMIARSGTGLLHILTTGLTSWALVSAWREHRYWRLAGIFTLSVFFHATWNTIGILSVFGTIAKHLQDSTTPLSIMTESSTYYAIGIHAGVMLLLLGLANRRLAAAQATGPDNEPEANRV